jgi:hypothetical protein
MREIFRVGPDGKGHTVFQIEPPDATAWQTWAVLDRVKHYQATVPPFVSKLFYLAAPHALSPHGPHQATEHATQIAASLMDGGINVYSPLTHGQAVADEMTRELSHAEWLNIDEPYMQAACACIVAKLPGWQQSRGVAYEIQWFHLHQKPVFLLPVEVDPETLEAFLA